jgi:nitronate monooxygenase
MRVASPLLTRLGVTTPIVQAPMAGVSTPAMAAAVSSAGGLGSVALGAGDAAAGRNAIAEVRARTDRAFAVNLFVHVEPVADPVCERAWLAALAPAFAEFGAEPPAELRTIYRSFAADPDMLAMLVEARPPVVSFHFGLPPAETIAALRDTGAILLATATSSEEACAVAAAGIDIVVAQGIEAGGHRGMFDPDAPDDALGTMALTRLLVRQGPLPVVAAGGIMDGAGVAAALSLGAEAAQLGTAFVLCPESAADEGYRRAMASDAAAHTRLTTSVSGRPARSLASRFTALDIGDVPPAAYPRAYDAGKALHAAARAKGEHGFGAHWAGQGAPLARSLPAAELTAALVRELDAARR